jgi:hypothetical protein
MKWPWAQRFPACVPRASSATIKPIPRTALLRSRHDVMTHSSLPKTLTYLPNFTARKVQAIPGGLPEEVPDSLTAWATRYLGSPHETDSKAREA